MREFYSRPRTLESVEDAPEEFREALGKALAKMRPARTLIFTPAWDSSARSTPSSVLAITEDAWLLAEKEESGIALSTATFDRTMRVGLTSILMYGGLAITHLVEGEADSFAVSLQYTTVREPFYLEAAQMLLDGIAGSAMEPAPHDRFGLESFAGLTLKFRYAALKFTPANESLRALVFWPGVFSGRRGWLRRELAPAALLALTERTLMVIREEKTWSWIRMGRINKYGNIVTYCSLPRLLGFSFPSEGEVELRLRTQEVEENLRFRFPPEQAGELSTLLSSALDCKARMEQANR